MKSKKVVALFLLTIVSAGILIFVCFQLAMADKESLSRQLLGMLILGCGLIFTVVAIALARLLNKEKEVSALVADINDYNQKYIVDNGSHSDAASLRENLRKNLEKAIDFSEQISKGNYTAEWKEASGTSSDKGLLSKVAGDARPIKKS